MNAPVKVAAQPDLRKAEQLVQVLETNAPPFAPDRADRPRRLLNGWTFPEQDDPDEEELYIDEHDPEADYGSPVRGHGRNNLRRRIASWMLRAVVLAVVALGAYQGNRIYELKTASDTDAYASARAVFNRGEYTEAAEAFIAILGKYPESPLCSDAQFMAAYALQYVPGPSGEKYTAAIQRFEWFISDYPEHSKNPRAQTLLGILYYKSGDNHGAIAMLRRPERRKEDPDAYLPTMRTLARAYAAVGEMDNARTTSMRAASLDENVTPDRDYLELAALYEDYADRSEDPTMRLKYLLGAVEQWDYALRIPGVLHTRRKEIRAKRAVAAQELERAGFTVAGEPTELPNYERSASDASRGGKSRETEQVLLDID